ncbi:hypothetical protein TanjilG_21815 [Lupinus angustifolius]|uniref:Uncharacterized protein n=1 Tax=Lupinus angustifolius TaxID=3871 RepID=A0A394DBM8_LUPAN|nr:hypothetical protein TanjilG_21815 [Lupinus angustifolius]
MAELRSPTRSSRRSHSQTSLWSLSPVGPPLPVQSSSQVPLQLPFLMSSQPSLLLAPPASKRSVSHDPIPSPTTEHGWESLTPLATGYRTYAVGQSSIGTKPFGFGPDFCARAQPPSPKVNIGMNVFVENKRKMEMVQAQKSVFPSTSRGTGVFHPLPSVQLQSNNNNNIGMKHNEVGGSKPINFSNANAGVLVKHEECHELSLADEYGLPKEWTY